MRYSIRRISGPSQEPVSLGEGRLHLKIDDDQTAENDLVSSLIAAARQDCEEATNRCFCWSTWEMLLDAFPDCWPYEIKIPRPPLYGVLSVRYTDADGVQRELGSDQFQVDTRGEPGRIRPAYGVLWPATRDELNAVRIAFTAGYAPSEAGSPTDYAANVPDALKAAIKLQLGHLYRIRESVNIGNIVTEIPMGVDRLLAPYRVIDFDLST